MDTAKALELLDQVVAALALPTPPSLTTKQRKAATRSRKGMERVIPTLANLSKEHGVSVPKQSTSQMTSQLALVSELEPVQQKLVGILTLVGNTLDDARSSSWTTGTTLYGMLRKVAYRDPQLGSQLAPVKEFFAYRTAAAQEAHPKQKSKKQALANEKAATAKAETAASPATPAPAPEPPSASSAPAASTNASAPAPASPSVVTPHVP
jgi:peptidoglycan hydrolase CwlO-like protein